MSQNEINRQIPIEKIWTVPANRFGIPVSRHAINVNGSHINVMNQRRFGRHMSSELHHGAPDERDTVLRGLLNLFPDGHGHGGQFEDDYKWKNAVRKASELPTLDDETARQKVDVIATYQQNRLAGHLIRVSSWNGDAQAETRLYGAFAAPGLGPREWGLARVAGVELARRGEDMIPGLIFQGRDEQQFCLPDRSGPIYPYVQVV